MRIPFTGYEPTPSEERLLTRAIRLWLLLSATAAGALYLSLSLVSFSQPVIVPRVTGLDQKVAERNLRAKGLRMSVEGRQWDDRLGTDGVIAQKPGPNAYLKRGSTVSVLLSKGNPQVKVPTLSGQSVRRAQVLLTQSRLRVGRRSILSTALFPPDTVLAQWPEPGASCETSSTVDLLTASGPKDPTYFMPDLKNLPLGDALQLFRPAGIVVDKIKTEVQDDLESGTILGQTPPAGTRLQTRSNVSFTVSARSSDAGRQARWSVVVFEMPEGPPKRLRIDVLDNSGTRTVYNAMEEGAQPIEVGVSVSGKATAQVYLNNQFVRDIEIQ